MTDYWLSKLFFDLQRGELGAAYRADRAKVLEHYPLQPEIKAALLRDDIAVLAPLVNPYLLRYYFSCIGTSDAVFIDGLRAAAHETANQTTRG